jgi:hypothetical protein
MNIEYNGIVGTSGTVAANIMALITLQAHANNSAQNRSGHSVKSRLM